MPKHGGPGSAPSHGTVLFDYGGTLVTAPDSGDLSDAFCAWARTQLRDNLNATGLRKTAHILDTDDTFRRCVTPGLRQEARRRARSEREAAGDMVWRHLLGLDAEDVGPGFAEATDELTTRLETDGVHRRLQPGALAALNRLRDGGWRIGLVSNTVSRTRIPRELHRFGLDHLLSPIVLSVEYGFRKPDPSIFHHAARLSRTPTKRCWYVGDTISRDVLGARRAGFAGVVHLHGTQPGETRQDLEFWRDRFSPAFFEPDASTTDWEAIPEILERLSRPVTVQGADIGASTPTDRWVDAFVFDASDVLYYRPHKADAFEAFLNKLGDVPERAGGPGREEISERVAELEELAFIGEIGREEHYHEILQLHGIRETTLIEEGLQALKTDSDSVRFFPAVPETLKELARTGFLLAVVSNTILPLHDKLRFFEQGGFGDVWDSIVLSVDVGARKPDPAIYLHAADQLGLAPATCAFVGHEPHEIDGARAAGMRTVSFNCDAPIGAEVHIDRFSELLRIAGKRGTSQRRYGKKDGS